MIAANELRIGNLINYVRNDLVVKTKVVDHNLLAILINPENTIDIAYHYGIELNEECLLRFGFIKHGLYYHFPNHEIFKLEQHKLKNAYWLKHGYESLDSVRINYVHQLQNLFFALTQKELEI
jgi:hypothetical protein